MKEALARLVYNVLESHCGAEEDDRGQFTSWFTMLESSMLPSEYRFCGNLGFGGKLYVEHEGLRVGMYPEHETGARRMILGRVNRILYGVSPWGKA